VERVKRASSLNRVVVATTVDPSDDPVEAACLAEKIDVFRGSLPDVLDRYYQAAVKYHADVVVRLTGDCPLIDPVLIDDVVAALTEQGADFACNRLPPPFSRTLNAWLTCAASMPAILPLTSTYTTPCWTILSAV